MCVRVVELHVTLDAERLRLMVEDLCDLGVLDQCLGRDAAHVQAHATPVFLLNYSNFLAKLCCADSGDIATGASAEYNNVKMFFSHVQ